MKENKFMMGQEEENSKIIVNHSTIVPTSHKKPIRHHVKRRSSGRVHVAKIAPMARANAAHTDSEAELGEENNNERPTMRRSQSQRSLHRMSFERKGFAPLTTRRKSVTSSIKVDNFEVEKPKIITSSTHPTNNPASLSDRVIAKPIEQTFHATANNLVVPKKAMYPKITSPMKQDVIKKPFLRSQFISTDESSSITTTGKRSETLPFHMTTPTRTNLSRTQQKLMLQRQQSQLEDETSPIHPRNMQKINKETELLNREYRCIKKYQDPMKDSLIRCLDRLNIKPNSVVTRIQLGANQHSISNFVVPTMSQVNVPHLEQRQIAHRHYHLKSIALCRNNNISRSLNDHHSSIDKNQSILGITTAFLDRMFNSSSS